MSQAARSLSLWHDTLPDGDLENLRSPVDSSAQYDVAIVGAGFTGLWTAYYLARKDPSLSIVVLEKEFAGFGASGRNGGWASGLLPMSLEQVARESSREAALALQRAANDTVDEVGKVAAAEGIDAHFAKGGYLRVATSPVQLERLRADVAQAREWEQTETDLAFLDRQQAQERINADSIFGAVFTPHCAAIHPARLARGLADAVEKLGVTVCEQTTVTAIEPGCARTDQGDVRAKVVVRAMEGYTATLPQYRRAILPIYSLMIATEPLPDHVWEEIGWRKRETFNDDRRFLIYAQRTADGRIAFGGRGSPYHAGSRIDPSFEHPRHVHDDLRRSLIRLFPSVTDAAITHRWGGVLGIPRDWFASVNYDRSTGLASAGGYSGDGVALTNLAGRTLADLITETPSDLTRLPWVGHQSRKFEPEPLRFLGINTGFKLAEAIDVREARTGRTPRILDKTMHLLTGH
ncbi:MAG TPA: FAD-dependent oxidoreductase [Actinomycetes bacterium]|nr:FAD-dependent oxidoreductase [Actinomycetes bacterium]